ncbi:uncharacterized protein CEXT_307081 [Caerostris extrusa]|uniref:Uncharacterized protein n=1 Tax=Caerostris extrusa TaxID=172846 RepID=A0AAV4QEL9_CAEEX|nr:uncharacterized protein CEXT_307081 [Caerostris extrusa]
MLYDKYNIKILQELDARGQAPSKQTTSKINVAQNSSKTQDKKYATLLKAIEKKSEENDLLQKKINKITGELNILTEKLKESSEELKETNEKCRQQAQQLFQVETAQKNSVKEINRLENQLERMMGLKRAMAIADVEKAQLLKKINHLERSLVMEQLFMRKVQEFILKQFSKEEKTQTIHEYYDFLKRHVTLQKQYRKKVNGIVQKDLELKEKDKMVYTIINSKITLPKEELLKSFKNAKTIKAQKREIRALIAQVNMSESTAAAFKTGLDKLKQESLEQKYKMKNINK